jgi:signal transduction histidine kinase
VLTGLLSRGIARPIEALGEATREVARGGTARCPMPGDRRDRDPAHSMRDFAQMAAAIDRRSRYLRDFAHAVSHEFKTPLAGIRGAIELLRTITTRCRQPKASASSPISRRRRSRLLW